MNTRPVWHPSTLEPVQKQPFTIGMRRHDIDRARYVPSVQPLPDHFDVNKLVIATAVASIRKAFTLAKTSHDAWRSHKREGRLDVRRAPAASRGDHDIFKRQTGRSTTRVKCYVVIDASGSMHGVGTGVIPHPDNPKKKVKVTAAMAAAVFGATIARAIGTVPTVDLDIFQHSHGGSRGGALIMKHRWAKGTPVAVFNEAGTTGIGGGGNADGHALFAVVQRMQREIKRGERGIILMVSDGLPADYSHDGKGDAGQALIDAVAAGRKAGFEVIGVSIDGTDQSAYYGKGLVTFRGDWTALGSELAQHIGAALAR